MRFLIFIIYFFIVFTVNATESDPYTFSDIPLKDSALVINYKLNHRLKISIDFVNGKNQQNRLTDPEILSLFFSMWQAPKILYLKNLEFMKFFKAFAIGDLEGCIMANSCNGPERIERIFFYPGESIFDEADYNIVTKTFLAPIINLCGVRIGADKLSHFTDDGRQYFKGWMSGIPLETLNLISYGTETSANGQTYTEVISRADHFVNMAGLQFFRNFFTGKDPYIVMGSDGKLKINKAINICKYVSSLWDETTLKNENIYNGQRSPQLRDAIAKRKLDPNPLHITKLELINREYKEPPVLNQVRSGGLFWIKSDNILIPEDEQSMLKMLNMPEVNSKKMIFEGQKILRN